MNDSVMLRLMSGFDEESGTVNLHDMLPETGDTIIVRNCGTHYEIRHQRIVADPPLYLTDEDLECLMQGRIVWN